MSEQIAGYAAARHGRIQPPQPGAALRQVGGNRPILEELGPVVENLAEPPFVDELFGQRDRGNAAIIVPDHVWRLGGLDRLHHPHRFGRVSAERLLAHHHLAGLGGGDGDLGVRVVRARDVDEIDVRARDQLAPIRLEGLIAPLLGKTFDLVLVAAADRLQHRLIAEIEELVDLAERIGMGSAHEAVADEANVELALLTHVPPPFAEPFVAAYCAQPCASRTLIMAARMSFQVCGFIISEFGNMQPSQQMCWHARVTAPLSSRNQ